MSDISLRQGRLSDWATIERLLKANQLPLEGAREHLSTFVIAELGGKIVGCAGAEPLGSVALLRSVAVEPNLHNQGIGEQLVSLLLEEARRRNFEAVYLLTTTAHDYFSRFGFAPVDRSMAPGSLRQSAEFLGACPESATLMSLTLRAAPSSVLDHLPVAVLGAGPVGLAAAAALIERGISCVIFETASTVGANLIDYGHVRLFSPWRYAVDPAMARLLEPTGWQTPVATELPLAGDVVRHVLEPFARLPQVASVLQLETRVLSVSREGFDKVKSAGREQAPFVIRAQRSGMVIEMRARAVIDSTGTWNNPNPLGANGLPAIGEREAAAHIFHGIPDVLDAHRQRYEGKRTLVVGAGHSAANALLSLADLARQAPGTSLVWAVRSPILTRVFGAGNDDALPARGALGESLRKLRESGRLEFRAGLRITRIAQQDGTLSVIGIDSDAREQRIDGVDEIICATGQRPDLSLTSELRVKLDPWLESTDALGPLIDPNVHSCGTVRPHGHRELGHPESGLYTVGVKSYGRAPTFLMVTGFEQVRSVVAAIARDMAAADRVELELPATGVCGASEGATKAVQGTTPAFTTAKPNPPDRKEKVASSTCCGGPATSDTSACCVLDEQKKAEGAEGCGCAAAGQPASERAREASACC